MAVVMADASPLVGSVEYIYSCGGGQEEVLLLLLLLLVSLLFLTLAYRQIHPRGHKAKGPTRKHVPEEGM